MGFPSAALAPLRKNDGAKKNASEDFPILASASRLVVTSFVSFGIRVFTTKDTKSTKVNHLVFAG